MYCKDLHIYILSYWEYVLQQFTNVTYMLRTLKRLNTVEMLLHDFELVNSSVLEI